MTQLALPEKIDQLVRPTPPVFEVKANNMWSCSCLEDAEVAERKQNMFYWKTTILPIIILSVASLYFLQVGSTVSWFFNHVKQLSLKLQRAAHQLADVICNKPEECKLTFDEFFEFLNEIPQELWNTVANFLLRNGTSSSTEQTLNRDDETARKQRRAIIYLSLIHIWRCRRS